MTTALTLRMVTAIVETEGYEAVAVRMGERRLAMLQQDADVQRGNL